MGMYIDCRHVGRLLEDVGLFRLPGLGNSSVAVRCFEKSDSKTGFSSLFDTAPVAAANPNLSKLFFLNSQLIIPRIYGLSFYFTPPTSYM